MMKAAVCYYVADNALSAFTCTDSSLQTALGSGECHDAQLIDEKIGHDSLICPESL